MNDVDSQRLELIAVGFGLAFAFTCIFLWIRRLKWGPLEKQNVTIPPIQPWSQSWLDFMIVFWSCVMVYLALVLVIIRYVFPTGFDPALEVERGHEISWYTILYSSSIQIALIITLIGSKYSYKIRFFEPSVAGNPALLGFDVLVRFLPVLWVGAALSMWITHLLGVSSGEQEAVTMLQGIASPAKFIALALLAVVGAPVLEELFFRGILLRFLLGYVGKTAALCISATLFSFLHFNTDSFIPISILGFLLGKVYLDTGDIRSSIWMHVFFNAQSVLIIAVERWIP